MHLSLAPVQSRVPHLSALQERPGAVLGAAHSCEGLVAVERRRRGSTAAKALCQGQTKRTVEGHSQDDPSDGHEHPARSDAGGLRNLPIDLSLHPPKPQRTAKQLRPHKLQQPLVQAAQLREVPDLHLDAAVSSDGVVGMIVV